MTKLQALQYLTEQGLTEGDAGYAVSAKLAEKSKIAKKGEVKIKAQAPKAKSATKSVTPRQILAAVEDAPL
jgi:hypothetical protein